MNLHVLQHVEFEGPGRIAAWAGLHGINLTKTRLYEGEPLPEPESCDAVVVMGGPMNIYEHAEYPWLPSEKAFLAAFVATGKPVLGVCLGAQLLADVLGAKVYPNRLREIGWSPVQFTEAAQRKFPGLPDETMVLHWHGDTYDLPPGACLFASNETCTNQGYTWSDHVLALQFHLEAGSCECQNFTQHGSGDLEKAGPAVQSAEEILAGAHLHAAGAEVILHRILDGLFSKAACHEASSEYP